MSKNGIRRTILYVLGFVIAIGMGMFTMTPQPAQAVDEQCWRYWIASSQCNLDCDHPGTYPCTCLYCW